MSREERSPPRGTRVVFYRDTQLGRHELTWIQQRIDVNQSVAREHLAREICRRFGWRRPNGDLPIRSCLDLLRRLDRRGLLRLPERAPRQRRLGGVLRAPVLAQWPRPTIEPTGELVLRLLSPNERGPLHECLARCHYLGDHRTAGESLFYAAFLGEEMVAVLVWAAAALHNRPRDQLLGWSPAARVRRLAWVANNSRFLVLPWIKSPHLASRVLGANLRRLSRDWERVHGHAILLAETFVDASRFRGTCYRAANWRRLGQTSGFSRTREGYRPNGSPKSVFVYPLHRRALQWLGGEESPLDAQVNRGAPAMMKLNLNLLPLDGRDGLVKVLRLVPDHRDRQGRRYPLASLLAISACAVLCGAKGFRAIADWAADLSKPTLRRFGITRLKNPSEPTIRRALQGVDAEQVDRRLGLWLLNQGAVLEKAGIAIDGKTARGGAGDDGKAPHLVSALLHREGIVIAQHQVPEKTNEIKSVEPLLEGVDIRGAVVTGDAMFMQTSIAKHIVEEKGADYLFGLKDNQPTLRDLAESLQLEAFPPSA